MDSLKRKAVNCSGNANKSKIEMKKKKNEAIGITRTVDYVKVKFTHKLLADCLIWPKAQRQTQCCDSVRCDAHALNICLTIWLFVY